MKSLLQQGSQEIECWQLQNSLKKKDIVVLISGKNHNETLIFEKEKYLGWIFKFILQKQLSKLYICRKYSFKNIDLIISILLKKVHFTWKYMSSYPMFFYINKQEYYSIKILQLIVAYKWLIRYDKWILKLLSWLKMLKRRFIWTIKKVLYFLKSI